MHYYQHHIGDFIKATARLSDSQTMTYLRMLWMYYDTEKPFSNDPEALAFLLGANVQEVILILNSFFKLIENEWRHTRCDDEIAKFHLKSDRAKTANKIRWGSKMDEKSYPDKIATNNHKPITNIKDIRPDDVSEDLWKDFKGLRSKKKAPITDRVLKTIRNEAAKIGMTLSQAIELMVVRGWTGFDSTWVKDKPKASALPSWAKTAFEAKKIGG